MEEMKGKEDRKAIRKHRNLRFLFEVLVASFRKSKCFDYFDVDRMNTLLGNIIYRPTLSKTQ